MQRALSQFPIDQVITVRLNPEDVSACGLTLKPDAAGRMRDVRWISDAHIQRGMIGRDPKGLRRAAAAAASILLLSNSVGISRAETADGDGYIRFSVVPHQDKNDLEAVLRRRLFISSTVAPSVKTVMH